MSNINQIYSSFGSTQYSYRTNASSEPTIDVVQSVFEENKASLALTEATEMPTEVWTHISTFLDERALLCFACVCKQSNDIFVSNPTLRILTFAKSVAHQMRNDSELADLAFLMIALTETLINQSDRAETTAKNIKNEYYLDQAQYLIDEIILTDHIIHGAYSNLQDQKMKFFGAFDPNEAIVNSIHLLSIKRSLKENLIAEAQKELLCIDDMEIGIEAMRSISLAKAEKGLFKEALEIYDKEFKFIPSEEISEISQKPKCEIFLCCAKSGRSIEEILPLFYSDHENMQETLSKLEPLFQSNTDAFFEAICLFVHTESDHKNTVYLIDYSRKIAAARSAIRDKITMFCKLAKIQKMRNLPLAALETLKMAEEFIDETNKSMGEINQLVEIGEYQLELSLSDDPYATFNRAFELAKKRGWGNISIRVLLWKAEAEMRLNKCQEARKTYESAVSLADDQSQNLYYQPAVFYTSELKLGFLKEAWQTAQMFSDPTVTESSLDEIATLLFENNRFEEAKQFLDASSSASDLFLARVIASVAKEEHLNGKTQSALKTISTITIPFYRILALLSLISPKNLFDFKISEDLQERLLVGPNTEEEPDELIGIEDTILEECYDSISNHIDKILVHCAKGNLISRASS